MHEIFGARSLITFITAVNMSVLVIFATEFTSSDKVWGLLYNKFYCQNLRDILKYMDYSHGQRVMDCTSYNLED